MICVQDSKGNLEGASAVLYTPHGVEPSTLSVLTKASPPVKVLALLHGLHDVSLKWTKQLNLGAINAVQAQQVLGAKYWVGTHDEQKPGSGLITPLLRRKILTVQEAVARVQAAEKMTDFGLGLNQEMNFVELGNGESTVLE